MTPRDSDEVRIGVLDAVRYILENIPKSLQPQAARWITEEGLKALAYSHGAERAAMAAYELADFLATGRRVR